MKTNTMPYPVIFDGRLCPIALGTINRLINDIGLLFDCTDLEIVQCELQQMFKTMLEHNSSLAGITTTFNTYSNLVQLVNSSFALWMDIEKIGTGCES